MRFKIIYKKFLAWRLKRIARKRLLACRWGPDFDLEEARIKYITANLGNSLDVAFIYDSLGGFKGFFPEGVDTKNKICVFVFDDRDAFSNKSGTVLLDEFKKRLEAIFVYIQPVAKNMNVDIVAGFAKREGKHPLGYFHQGEYHLWE